MARKLAKVDHTLCVACGCCGKVCPRDAVSVFQGIYAKIDSAACIGCGKCAKTCPADLITMISREVVS